MYMPLYETNTNIETSIIDEVKNRFEQLILFSWKIQETLESTMHCDTYYRVPSS